jgi:hypothetical protein
LKKTPVLFLMITIAMVALMVLSACGGTTGTTTTTATTSKPAVTATTTVTAPAVTKEVQKINKVINPQGTYIPVETKPCAPRLNTFDGKKIFYYKTEANAVIMPVLFEKLKQRFPNTEWGFEEAGGFGRSTPTENDLKYDAVIRGVSW